MMSLKGTIGTTLLATIAVLAIGVGMQKAEAAVIFEETFETDGLGTRYTAPNGTGSDGDEDYWARISNGTSDRSYTNVQGEFYWGGQDTNDAATNVSGTPTLLFENINIAGYINLSFSAYFAEQRPEASGDDDIDAPDFALVEYQIDDGGFLNLIAFENDGSTFNTTFLEDTNFDGTGDGTQLETAFAQFSKNIVGTGSSLDLRFTASVDSGDEDIAIDSIEISGDLDGPVIPEPATAGLLGLAALALLRRRRMHS